jgi:transcriptional regulator with XRE-family HTH domain
MLSTFMGGEMADIFLDLTKNEKFQKEQKEREGTSEFLLEGLMLRISEQILSELRDKKWSYSEFANRLGVSQPYISKILNGKPNLTLKSLAQIAAVLGFSFNENVFNKEMDDVRMFSRTNLNILEGGLSQYDPELAGQAG